MTELFDRIVETLHANGWDANDVSTLKRSAEEPVSGKVPGDWREAYLRLHEAAERAAPIFKAEGLVGGELWDELGTDFLFCLASGMVRLYEVGQEPDGEQGDPGG